MCVGGGLIWGGIGAWIDSRIEGQEIVYRKSDPKTTVRIAPQVALVGTKRVGIGGSITWR